MFGKQQFVGKVEGSVTDKYDLIKVFVFIYLLRKIQIFKFYSINNFNLIKHKK